MRFLNQYRAVFTIQIFNLFCIAASAYLIFANTAYSHEPGGGIFVAEPEFHAEREPKYHAFVVGNSSYGKAANADGTDRGNNFSEIDSVISDVMAMRKAFRNLGYSVFPEAITDPVTQDTPALRDFQSRKEFTDLLAKFLSEVSEGDVVVFYYSGHGFMHNNTNYIVPAFMDKSVPSSQVDVTAIAVRDIVNAIAKAKVAFTIAFIDACRTFVDFDVVGDNFTFHRRSGVEGHEHKSLYRLYERSGFAFPNRYIAFATTSNEPAQAIKDKTKPSPFTEALLKFAFSDQGSVNLFGAMDEINLEVQENTTPEGDSAGQLSQKVDWLGAFKRPPRFSLTPGYLSEKSRKVWDQAIISQEDKGMRSFLNRYPWSSHASAARLWRVRHRGVKKPVAVASRDPCGVLRAGENSTGLYVSSRISGSLFDPASEIAFETADRCNEADDLELGIFRSTNPDTLSELVALADNNELFSSAGLDRDMTLLERAGKFSPKLTITALAEAAHKPVSIDPGTVLEFSKYIDVDTSLNIPGIGTGKLARRIEVPRARPSAIPDLDPVPYIAGSTEKWILAREPESGAMFQLPPSVTGTQVDTIKDRSLGRASPDFQLPPDADIPELIDEEQLRKFVAETRGDLQKSLDFAALAVSPVDETLDESSREDEMSVKQLRLLHAKNILIKLGIPKNNIYTVEGSTDAEADKVLVRIYGY